MSELIVEERSFGVIPLDYRESKWLVFLVLHRMGKHWAFPKGKQQPGESSLEAAMRELREETGLKLVELIRKRPFIERYRFQRLSDWIDKRVDYYLAKVSGHVQLQEDEIQEGKWVDLSQASILISFREAQNVCRRVERFLKKL